MPEFFKQWLEALNKEQLDLMWDWFDSDSRATGIVIEVVCDTINRRDGCIDSRQR